MTMYTKGLIYKSGQQQKALQGDNPLCGLVPYLNAATGADVIDPEMLAGGVYIVAIGSAVTHTTATAAAILAANPDMSVGDTAAVVFSNPTAYVLTVAGGTGVTASGTLTVAAGVSRTFLLTKTSATTMTIKGL